jgi:carbon monoxide dehydrogenase subunit G
MLVIVRYGMLPAPSRLWRGQEYRADAAAADVGYAPGLRQAVTYLRGSFDGQRSGWDRTLLASHPPNELRLERLRINKDYLHIKHDRMPALGSRAVKSTVSVTQERRIAASPATVWYLISTPEMHDRLDPRCHLESTTGNGDVGSEYVLNVRAGLAQARLRYVVREAIPEKTWVAEIDRAGKDAGVQPAELIPQTAGTLLRWTVTLPTGRLTRCLVTAWCERELDKWLGAVDRHSLSMPGGTA